VTPAVAALVWTAATAVALAVGWVTGGNDTEAFTIMSRLPHNLWFGFVIGLGQAVALTVLAPAGRPQRWAVWPLASGLGFALGAGGGHVFIHNGGIPEGFAQVMVFSTSVSVCMAGAQALAMRQAGGPGLRWGCWAFLGWMAGELSSVYLGYDGALIPFTGAVIAGLATPGLRWVWPAAPAPPGDGAAADPVPVPATEAAAAR
jgi:hypothetical protein